MRIDRLLTLGVVGPARRLAAHFPSVLAPAERGRLPILMYHSISEESEKGIAPYYRTATAPSRFAEQMGFLRRTGWRAVSLSEGLRRGAGLPPAGKTVVLTFDDGFQNFSDAAMPVLRELGFGATMFLPTAFVSGPGERRRFCGRTCLSWAEIRRLDAEGVEFGSHSHTHPKLLGLAPGEIDSELGLSKAAIERQLGRPVASFSYPYAYPEARADFCGDFRRALLRAGYAACVTTQIGCAAPGDDPYRLRRLPMNGADDLALLAAKLEGAYDWAAGPQWARKILQGALTRQTSPSP